MVRRLCSDGDGVQVVVGPPGTGKTFALDAAREAWQASGFVVCGAAVARQAARGMWDAAGIESTSVAALLGELGRGPEWGMTARSVLVVDEAGMLGTRDLARLLDHASEAGAKVVLVGDHHQLPEIDAGGVFRALVSRTSPVRLDVNRRQQQPHSREMLDLWRQARVRDALTIASEHGELVMASNAEELHARMVTDYCAAITTGDDAVMITQRRADARDLNARARAWLDATGQLGEDHVELAGGRFAVGDRVVLKLNDRSLGVENGSRGRVVAIDAQARTVTVETSGDRRVTLPRTYLERRTAIGDPTLLHGYAGTAHVAQGMTTGRAFVLGSDIAYREWGYVAWSRARLETRFYMCEPDGEEMAAEHHTAAPELPGDGFEDTVAAMQRSRAQHVALDLVDSATIRRLEQRAVERTGRVGRHGDRRVVGKPHTSGPRLSARTADARGPGGSSAGASAPHRQEPEAVANVLRMRRDPPPYVLTALGERPAHPQLASEWDRAVEWLERHRIEHGVVSREDALGPRPSNLQDQVSWRNAHRRISAARDLLTSPTITRRRERDL